MPQPETVLKNGRLVADDTRIVPLAELDEALSGPGPIGVAIGNAEALEPVLPHLGLIQVIALNFPRFNDGRAYSQARLLREKHGYGGEIRATGAVLRDQLQFMARVGFDAFVVQDPDPLAAWRWAQSAITRRYQPA
ncbi:MAG: hypothetical protein OHK0024_35640 [Thalassobaculales bacterium]